MPGFIVKILIIDDDEDDYFITSGIIKQMDEIKCEVDWCYKYTDALTKLQSKEYHIYFVDYKLGAKTGIDFLKFANEINNTEPIVLLTGKGNRLIDRQAMKIGATDYLIKSELSPEKLERCIRYSLERSNYLKALKDSENKYRTIFEQSRDAVFTATPQLVFIDVNAACCELVDYSIGELQQISLYQLLNDQSATYIQNAIKVDGELFDCGIELKTKNQEIKYCTFSATTQKGTNGNKYIQGILHDITNLKKAEKINIQIEKLAAADRLVRTLAHEVRNPLNNVSMSVEQIKLNLHSEEIPLYLDIIQRNSDRISKLINHLLDSSKPVGLDLKQEVLQNVLTATIQEASDRVSLQKINLHTVYHPKPAYVNIDKEKLKIAFLNIIINAIESMQTGGRLDIKVETGNMTHSVTIKDDGTGIPAENLSKLFEPYFTSKRNGVGLGLSSALNIIQSHAGNIDVKSDLGSGTVFTVVLPVYKPD